MIQIGPLIQGTIVGSGQAFQSAPVTLIPEPTYSDDQWKSSVWGDEVDFGLPFTGRGVVVNHTSPDNITYAQTGLDPDTFFTSPNRRLRPSLFGGAVVAFQGGIWVHYKNGDALWVSRSLSSIPDANVGGGVIAFINFANGEFIIAKNTTLGTDLYATADFETYRIPSGGFNDIGLPTYPAGGDPFTVIYAAGKYVAYYELDVDGSIQAATSTDLITWVEDSTALPAPTGATSQGASQRPYRDLAYFNGNHIVAFSDLPDGDDDLKTLHIWYSTDSASNRCAPPIRPSRELQRRGCGWGRRGSGRACRTAW